MLQANLEYITMLVWRIVVGETGIAMRMGSSHKKRTSYVVEAVEPTRANELMPVGELKADRLRLRKLHGSAQQLVA